MTIFGLLMIIEGVIYLLVRGIEYSGLGKFSKAFLKISLGKRLKFFLYLFNFLVELFLAPGLREIILLILWVDLVDVAIEFLKDSKEKN